jgi:hypothetical protein
LNIAIIGSGISSITAVKTFLEFNYNVYLFDANNFNEKIITDTEISYYNNSASPKFNNKIIKNSIKIFKEKYKLKTNNFFLTSSLISGGLANFWGSGIQFPEKKYLKKNKYSLKICKEEKFINNQIGIKKENYFKFYDFFYNQKFIQTMLKYKSKKIRFAKLYLAVRQFNKNNKIKKCEFINNCLLNCKNNSIYNPRNEIKFLKENKLFNYLPNNFVKNIIKINSKYNIKTSKGIYNLKFDKVIISAGTIGSTLLISKALKLDTTFRISHTPMIQLAYFNPFLPFIINNKKKFSLPLLQIVTEYNKKKVIGSFMYANNINNNFFGISKFNIFFSIIKKFLFIGNIFLPSEYSNSYLHVSKKYKNIYSNELKKNIILHNLKRTINKFLRKFNLYSLPFQNFKLLKNGSDAHYTSTLFNYKINNKKFLNNNCEVNGLKNCYVLDGSSIANGLAYPTYFIMTYIRFIVKRLINNDKKNKN